MDSSEFEDFLKCPICFDYLKVCMITSCSHNYCSLCIRKYLSYRPQCPMCFEETSEPELRNNRLVDNIVKFYVERSKNPLEFGARPEFRNQVLGADKPLVSEELQNHQPTQDSGEKAPCPVCNVMVKVNAINLHLDMCLNRDERMDSLRRGTSVSKRKKLPKVIYHFLQDKDLKKIVGDAGLNVEGDRQALIKRHKSYMVLYNSECDSLNPKPVSEIVKQVHDEENIEGALSTESPKELNVDKKMDPEVIEKKQKEYLKKHESQFCKLVEDIQQRQTKDSVIASKGKPVIKKCDMDTPGTSKCDTNNIEVDDGNLNKSPGPQECKDEVPEDDNPLSENCLPNADHHSGSESETDVSSNTTESTKNKLSRKKASVTECSASAAKRSRHPSDEF